MLLRFNPNCAGKSGTLVIVTADTGAYAGGGVHPPPTWEKSSAQKCPKEERKFRPDMSAKKNVNVPLRYDKIKTKKVGKKRRDK